MPDNNRTELTIKNMVCDRCKLVVRETLEGMGFEVKHVELGKAVVEHEDPISQDAVHTKLQEYGFELLKGKDRQLVEGVKNHLINYVDKLEEEATLPRVSDFLSENMAVNYPKISSAFSENEGITIEKYLIHLKIERVKELLSYGELTLSEIAHKLQYSSVAHLSNQFRETTGMSVTDYKKARDSFRKSLDNL